MVSHQQVINQILNLMTMKMCRSEIILIVMKLTLNLGQHPRKRECHQPICPQLKPEHDYGLYDNKKCTKPTRHTSFLDKRSTPRKVFADKSGNFSREKPRDTRRAHFKSEVTPDRDRPKTSKADALINWFQKVLQESSSDNEDDEPYKLVYERRMPLQAMTKKSHPRRTPSSLPKSLLYNGTGNWQAFFTKFSKYAETTGWTTRECKDNLCFLS